MTHKIAEVSIDSKDGGFISGYLRVKSHKRLHEKINKMLDKGAIKLGCLSVRTEDIARMELQMHEVN